MSLDSINLLSPLLAFLLIFVTSLFTIIVLFYAIGYFFEYINARHPEKKIQGSRINQRKRNELRKAPGSLVIIAACFSTGMFAQVQGWTLQTLEMSWWSVPILLVASIVLYDTWFYWAHRLLHTKAFYRFHAPHHRSVAPIVWSNHNESLTEAFFNQAFYIIIPFILPIPWQLLVVQKIYDQFTGMLGHAGYEHFASPLGRRPFPLTSTVFHDQHHSHFAYNYGHTFSFWDRLMGTVHPKYDEKLAEFEK
jgi:Delta7-sterol 5-desaturase